MEISIEGMTSKELLSEIVHKLIQLRAIGKQPEEIKLHYAYYRMLLESSQVHLHKVRWKREGWAWKVYGILTTIDNSMMPDSGIKIVCKEDHDNLAYMKWYHEFGRPMLEKAE